MSTFTTSRGTRGQHVEPRFASAPYRLHPARREHIYGRVQSDTRSEWRYLLYGAAAALAAIAFAPKAEAAEREDYRIETSEDRTRRAAMRWETAFVALSAIDLAITVQCLEAKTCTEANPLAKTHSTTKMIAIKSALTVGHYLFVRRLAKDHPKAALRFAQVSVGVQGGIVGLNIRTMF